MWSKRCRKLPNTSKTVSTDQSQQAHGTVSYGVSGGFVGTIWLHVAKDSVNITDGIEESAWLLL